MPDSCFSAKENQIRLQWRLQSSLCAIRRDGELCIQSRDLTVRNTGDNGQVALPHHHGIAAVHNEEVGTVCLQRFTCHDAGYRFLIVGRCYYDRKAGQAEALSVGRSEPPKVIYRASGTAPQGSVGSKWSVRFSVPTAIRGERIEQRGGRSVRPHATSSHPLRVSSNRPVRIVEPWSLRIPWKTAMLPSSYSWASTLARP